MRSAGRLMMAELHGNPFCKGQHQRYRDSIILMSDSLASLDGEEITQQQRAFLLRFQIQKLKVWCSRGCYWSCFWDLATTKLSTRYGSTVVQRRHNLQSLCSFLALDRVPNSHCEPPVGCLEWP